MDVDEGRDAAANARAAATFGANESYHTTERSQD